MSYLKRPVLAGYRRFILLVVLILTLAASAFWYWESWRAQHYREQTASMPMALLSYMLEGKQPSEQAHWVAVWGQRLGVDLSLIDEATLHFNYFQQRRLDSLQTVVEASDNGWRLFHLLPDGRQVLVLDTISFTERQPIILMQLLREWIEQQPPKARDARFDRLRLTSDWPMQMGSESLATMTPEQREQLSAHQIVTSISAKGPSLSMYALLNDGHWIAVGPITFYTATPIMPVVMLLVALGVLLVAMGCWLISIRQRRFARLQRAAERIARGDFTYRVPVDFHDPFHPLSHAINAMAEQVQASLSAQQDLIQAVSHEFRTPVARIRFALQMVADISESEAIQRQLSDIDNDIEAIDHLMDEILTYSRLESSAGQLPLAKEWIEAHELISDLIEQLAVRYPHIEVRMKGRAVLWVLADRRYLKRALLNVLCNACQYAEEQVEVRLAYIRSVACIQIDDDGPGIPASSRNKVFKPFVRLDGSRTRSSAPNPFSSGHGLGLAIVSKIVAWHAGRLIISSAPSLNGARFSMLIPTPPQDAKGQEQQALLPRVSR